MPAARLEGRCELDGAVFDAERTGCSSCAGSQSVRRHPAARIADHQPWRSAPRPASCCWVYGPAPVQVGYGRITLIDLRRDDRTWRVAEIDGRDHPLLEPLDLPPHQDTVGARWRSDRLSRFPLEAAAKLPRA